MAYWQAVTNRVPLEHRVKSKSGWWLANRILLASEVIRLQTSRNSINLVLYFYFMVWSDSINVTVLAANLIQLFAR